MTPSVGVLNDPGEIEAADADASVLMKEGIRLMHSGNDADAALVHFDHALELRRRLPVEVPIHAYGLAACWLNRAEALTTLGPAHHALALDAYHHALILLSPLPLADDVRFARRLAIAHQNRALILAAQNPPSTAEAIIALLNAVGVLHHADALDAPERDYLLAVVWMNLANIQAPDLAGREPARRALELTKGYELDNAAAAEIGLKARHVLCQIVGRRLSVQPKNEEFVMDIHEATDLADEGLALAREWELRGVDRLRDLAADLFRFGAQVYAFYQPQFLNEFLNEHGRHLRERTD